MPGLLYKHDGLSCMLVFMYNQSSANLAIFQILLSGLYIQSFPISKTQNDQNSDESKFELYFKTVDFYFCNGFSANQELIRKICQNVICLKKVHCMLRILLLCFIFFEK
jgi:hypothetical protein